MTTPQPVCARCGAHVLERAFIIGFADGGDAYCSECLSPEEVEMVNGFLSSPAYRKRLFGPDGDPAEGTL